VLAVQVAPPSVENAITVYWTASFPDMTPPSWSVTVPLRSTKPIMAQWLASAQVTWGNTPGP